MATTIKNEKPGNLILIGIATRNDLFSGNFLMSTWNMQAPINCTVGRIKVVGKPVDEAREELVDIAIKNGAKYLMFIDDDTLVPPDALLRLFHQLDGQDEMLASGVYYTKTQPSVPIILNKNKPAGVTDWRHGEVIHVDYAGCGCLLIKMDIFDMIDKPFFKFNRGRMDIDETRGAIGEDIWLCDKVAEKGWRVVVDTNVQCGHEDFARKLIYQYDARFGTGVWFTPGTKQVFYLPTVKQAEAMKASEQVKLSGQIAWGYEDMEGWTPSPAGDMIAIRTTHAEVTGVKIKNLLEYRANEESHGIIKAIYDVMENGAEIEIIVPDAVERPIYDDSTVEDIEKAVGGVNTKFVALYNMKWLEDSMKSAGFSDVTLIKNSDREIVAKGKK